MASYLSTVEFLTTHSLKSKLFTSGRRVTDILNDESRQLIQLQAE